MTKETYQISIYGVCVTIFAAICWGFSGTCSEFLFKTRGFTSEWLTMTRMLTAGLILLSISLSRKQSRHIFAIFKNKKDSYRLIYFAIAGLMTTQYTYLAAISFSNSGTATVIQYTGPAMVMLWSCLTLKKLPEMAERYAIILVLLGVFLLATHGNPSTLVMSKQGLIWGIISAVSYALATIAPRHILSRWGAATITGWSMLIGGIVFTFLIHPFGQVIPWDIGTVIGLVGLILIGTVMSFTLFFYGVSLIGPVRASMIASIEPVSAALFSHFWIGTTFSLIDIIGFIAIIAAVLLLSRK